MKYFLLDANLKCLAVSNKFPDECREDPSKWSRQAAGGVWNERYSNGVIGAGWINRNDFPDMAFAESLAASASELEGRLFIGADSGAHVSPRHNVVEAPKVGDEVSMSFNGDSYPIGKIVKISDSLRVVSVEGPKGPMKFYREGKSARWASKGWSLIPGSVYEQNPHF
jgi:hypothetical protein